MAVELPTIQPPTQTELSPEEIREMSAEVRALAAERNAVILAHNYEVPEIQEVADLTGDSLQLSREAAATEADVIAFCGVHFMAETASVLSPQKTVLIPDLDAGCSLSDSINADQLRAWKADHPGAVVVMYVNTSAEVKAETDYCCTSSNAVKVVEHIRAEHGDDVEILFGPDMWLGAFVEKRDRPPDARLGRRVPRPRRHPARRHQRPARRPPRRGVPDPSRVRLLDPGDGVRRLGRHRLRGRPHALDLGDAQARQRTPDGEFIVATETGMLYPLEQAAPQAELHAANRMAFCKYMKMITLPKLRDSLRDLKLRGQGPRRRRRARPLPIERMVAIG